MIGKLLPVVAEYNEIIRNYRIEVGNLRYALTISNLEADMFKSYKENMEIYLEQVEAKWWQSPVAIICYIVVSFAIGVMVVL